MGFSPRIGVAVQTLLTLEKTLGALFYAVLKIPVRLALRLFCARITIYPPALTHTPGPLLIVANHPNSFLDAIIISACFRRQVHFLARGEAFNKPWHHWLCRLLHMIPIYPMNGERENRITNEAAIERSCELLSKNRIVLVFIEGICKNLHELQPFKKTAARIVIACEGQSIPVNIMPAAIAYSSFNRIGKRVSLNLAATFGSGFLFPFVHEAAAIQEFNNRLWQQMQPLIRVPDRKENAGSATKRILAIPALAGWLLHLPLYSLIRTCVRAKTRGTVFFDSLLFSALFLLYPLYLSLLVMVLLLLHTAFSSVIAILLLHPLTAWCTVRWRIMNN